MAFTTEDICTPAAILPYDPTGAATAAQTLANGLILASPPLLGHISDGAAVDVEWNDGTQQAGLATLSLRFVEIAAVNTVSTFRGKMVRLSGASQEYTGLCLSVFALEATTTGKTGATSEVVLFRTRAGQFVLALATNVEVVAGQ